MVPKQPALNASMAEQLFQIVLGMIDRFIRTGDTKVFAAVTLLNASRLMFVPDYAQRPSTYAVLGMLHWIRYQRLTNSRADFDAAYRFFTHLYTIDPSVLPDGLREQFVEERPAPESIWEIQHTAGRVLVEEFYRDSGGLLLDNAIILYRMSLDAAPATYPERPIMEYNLGTALHVRFRVLKERDDLDAAVAALRRASETIPDGHPHKEAIWSALHDALSSRTERIVE